MKAALSIPALIAAAAVFSLQGDPQEAPNGIAVTGVGEAAVKPDTVVIRGDFSVNADGAGDALTKYRDGRRRALKMLESLGIEGLSVTGPGPMISVGPTLDRNVRQMMGWDPNQTDTDGKALIRETLTIRVGGLSEPDASADVVAKVLDKAKEAGIKIGGMEVVPQYLRAAWGWSVEEQKEQAVAVAYVVTDRAKLEESACVKAMEDARRRAEMLAKLAGRKVGTVRSIRHEDIPAEKAAFDGVLRVKLHVVFEFER